MKTLSRGLSVLSRAMCVALLLTLTLSGSVMNTDLPRNEKLPYFDPHRADFTCQVEAGEVPPIDAEADDWLLAARTLEIDMELSDEERDWKKIVQLTRQAAERRHWKAMLNLASLYLEGRDPAHGSEDAILLVEQGMRLGIPAAYDRMGTYYLNGVVPGELWQAGAFLQRAAEMGNPQAMAFLGEKLRATWDNPAEQFWANIPIAIKMLECALGQGDAQAALFLHYRYADPNTPEAKRRAMRVLHEGVKFGCAKCAHALQVDFNNPDPADTVVPHMDKVRGERYQMLGNALDYNPNRRFPNLDKMLPLPPAQLPHWDGKRETLLNAVMAVTPARAAPKPTAASRRSGREALGAAYDLRPTGEMTSASVAPFAAYWRPTAPHESLYVREHLAAIAPALYQSGEAFIQPRYPANMGDGTVKNVAWARMLTVHHNHGAVEPRAAAGLMREVAISTPLRVASSAQACPATGTWQPWLPPGHPWHHLVNQPWRQAWVTAGQRFPDPRTDWLLQLDASDLTWHLLDARQPNRKEKK